MLNQPINVLNQFEDFNEVLANTAQHFSFEVVASIKKALLDSKKTWEGFALSELKEYWSGSLA